MSLGKRLKAIRNQHKLTQQNIADILGIDRTTYTFYETGTTSPSLTTIYNLSKIYNVSVGYILGVEENRPELMVKGENTVAELVSDYDSMDNLNLSKKERFIIAAFRALDEDGKNSLIEAIKDYVPGSKISLKNVSETLD
ncbi:MAG: helix-turn-helix domain-containing protein [Acutalibacteraceae bacterium]